MQSNRNIVLFLMFNPVYQNSHLKFVTFYCRALHFSERTKQWTDMDRYESVTQTWVLLVDKQAASTIRLRRTFYHDMLRTILRLYKADSRQDDKFQKIIPHATWNFLLRNSALHSGRSETQLEDQMCRWQKYVDPSEAMQIKMRIFLLAVESEKNRLA